MALSVRSGAFTHEGTIPAKYTCEGRDISPPLEWDAGPKGTASYALIMDDPDAPRGTWVHWVAWNIQATSLPEDASRSARPPFPQGRNSWPKAGYGGPCPPSGTHRYYFKVYALDRDLELPAETDKNTLLAAMKGHVLDQGELMGKYAKKK